MPTHASSAGRQSQSMRRAVAALIGILLAGSALTGNALPAARAEEQSPYQVSPFMLFDKPSYVSEPPEISGKWVLWRGGPVANRFTLRNMETGLDSSLTIQGAPSAVPDVDGDTLVALEGNVQHEDGIFAYHIPDGARTTIVPHSAGPGFRRGAPRVSGNIVVWVEGHGGDDAIYGYDLAAQRRFTIVGEPSPKESPEIAGNVVVWRDGRNGSADLYGYDLATSQEFRITSEPEDIGPPAVSSQVVVWPVRRPDGTHLLAYDLATKERFSIARVPTVSSPTGFPSWPDADGDIVVWSAQGEVDQDVFGYDVRQRKQFVISRAIGNQMLPRISGKTVVWLDESRSCWDGPDQDVGGARLEPGPAPVPASGVPAAVDAKIEIVWPHGGAAVADADKANVGTWLLQPGTLRSVSCVWKPPVRLWMARNNEPARMVGIGRRDLTRRDISAWAFDDVDVSAAHDSRNKVYFYVTVDGVAGSSNVWAHAADARTYYPQQDTPAGVAAVAGAVEAKIEIVWPQGNAPVAEAKKVNVSAALFSPGTLLSVPPDFAGTVRLYRSLNNDVSREAATGQKRLVQAGGLAYPVWDFNDVDVSAANDPANKYYFTIAVDGVATYTNVWAHGADARTYFPRMDVVEGQ